MSLEPGNSSQSLSGCRSELGGVVQDCARLHTSIFSHPWTKTLEWPADREGAIRSWSTWNLVRQRHSNTSEARAFVLRT